MGYRDYSKAPRTAGEVRKALADADVRMGSDHLGSTGNHLK